ncbi:MAG: CotH kinase family protein [Bacteroidales bacterium]|jgi:hypothetical protein|nr:CotH kinase family protein [Bacteroidales bacterium]
MRKLLFTLTLLLALTGVSRSQNNTLFDDTRVSSIYVDLPADSLAWIMNNVLSDYYFHARFIFDDNTHRDTLENIGFRLRGNTSRYSLKKSFKISFNEYVSGRKYQGVKKINLNGEHNDPTMIREKLFYDLWKKTGMVERRTNFVKVFINGIYYGLYTNLEEMEKEWVTRVYPQNGGNLYKCAYPADLVYLGNDQQVYKDLENSTVTGGRVYDLQTNKSQDDYTRLVTLIAALNEPADSLFAINIGQILNVNEYLKALALDVATGNWDDYGYNKNNYYLYDNPASGQFEYIAYDPDNTIGVDWMQVNWGTRNCLSWINTTMPLPLAQKLLEIPDFFNRYKLYLDTIARNVINPDSVFTHISDIKQLITPAAITDTFRCLDYGYTVNDFHNGFIQPIDGHTPYGVRPFLATRYNSILNQLHPSAVSEIPVTNSVITLSPNPAGETITLWFQNGHSGHFDGEIIDNLGRVRKLFNGSPGNDRRYQLDIKGISSGIYFLRIKFQRTINLIKFIRE